MPFSIQRTQKVLGTSKTIYYVSAQRWTDDQADRQVFADRASAEAAIPAEVWDDCAITEE